MLDWYLIDFISFWTQTNELNDLNEIVIDSIFNHLGNLFSCLICFWAKQLIYIYLGIGRFSIILHKGD